MKLITKRIVVLVLVLSLSSFNIGCDNAKTVIKYVNRALPLLTAVGVDISDAREVIDLMNQFDKDPSAAILSATTIAFDRLVAKAQQIPEQGKRTVVMVILVGANIALQELADKFFEKSLAKPDDPRLGASSVRMQIHRFSQKKSWTCRAAGTVEKYQAGQYMPMEMCKKFPDNSVVETQ